MAAMQTCITDLNSTISGNIQESLDEATAKFNHRFAGIDGRLDEHATRHEEHDKAIEALRKELSELKAHQRVQGDKIGAVSDTINSEVASRTAPDPSFTRAPIRTLLRLSVASEVSKIDVIPVVERWLQQLYKKDQWRLDGPDSGKMWSLLFVAPADTAACMANRARGLLRNSDGSWQTLMVAGQ
eukprot:1180326-Karenia_brevis.AAC.1